MWKWAVDPVRTQVQYMELELWSPMDVELQIADNFIYVVRAH